MRTLGLNTWPLLLLVVSGMSGLLPNLATAQTDTATQRATDFFADTLGLNANATQREDAIAFMEENGAVVDIILPDSGDGQMVLLSRPVGQPAGTSQLSSIRLCPGSDTQIDFQRFFHTGSPTDFINAAIADAEAANILVDHPEREVPPGFEAQRLNPSLSVIQGTATLWLARGPLQDGTTLINFEAVIYYPCDPQN